MDTFDDLSIKRASSDQLSLLGLLSNSLVLYQTAPYLPPASLLALGATSKPFRGLIYHTAGVFRHLDLSGVKSVQFDIDSIDHGGEVWRNVQLDENVTEDDFYSGPLRGIFENLKKRHVLQDVQTLILDGLSVTSELITEIILSESFNVRVLSIRDVKNLNQRKLMQALEYAVRPSRPKNTPKLKALYLFGPKDIVLSQVAKLQEASLEAQSVQRGIIFSQGAQTGTQLNQKSVDELCKNQARYGDNWYHRFGEVFPLNKTISAWAKTLSACQGIISFDTILCTGPRHGSPIPSVNGEDALPWYTKLGSQMTPTVATVALKGCTMCHSAPEGMSFYGQTSPEALPLLSPPPLHSTSVRAATRPISNLDSKPRMLARCVECLKGRYCQGCYKWWCEDCYQVTKSVANPKTGAWRDCFECGYNVGVHTSTATVVIDLVNHFPSAWNALKQRSIDAKYAEEDIA